MHGWSLWFLFFFMEKEYELLFIIINNNNNNNYGWVNGGMDGYVGGCRAADKHRCMDEQMARDMNGYMDGSIC